MTINPETLIKVITANGHADLITQAFLIDNDAINFKKEGDKACIEIHRQTLEEKHRMTCKESWAKIPVQIISVNKYALKNHYTVLDDEGIVHTDVTILPIEKASVLTPLAEEPLSV